MRKIIFFILTFFSLNCFGEDNDEKQLLRITNEVVNIMENREYQNLVKYTYKEEGLFFTDIISMSIKFVNHITDEQIKEVQTNKQPVFLYVDDDPSEPMKTTYLNYFQKRFNINSRKLKNITVNDFSSEIKRIHTDNILNVVNDTEFVEYYYEPSGLYGDYDWISIYYIFKKYEGKYYLIGISRNVYSD